MGDYGIKVSQPGFDVKTASADQLVFSSKYKTLRVKAQGSGSITHSGGRTVTIAHNLGYVPYFLVHAEADVNYWGLANSGDYFIYPIVPIVAGACHINRDLTAYADSTNLYITVNSDFGWKYFGTNQEENNYGDDDPADYYAGWATVGYSSAEGSEDGAFRFNNVTVAQGTSVYKAELHIYIDEIQGDDIKYLMYGIDEDDTANFSSNPFGRTKTSAVVTANASNPSQWGYETAVGTTMRDIFNEIVGRGGWSSGNHMGFMLFDNGTDSGGDNYWSISDHNDDCAYCSCTHLKVLPSNTLCNYKYTVFYNENTG